MRDFSSFFLGRVRARSRGGPVGHVTGSGGGAQPGGDVAWRGDAARSPASNHAAYPGNSGSAGPSLGEAEISEAPPSPGTATPLSAAPTGPQEPRPRRSHSRCRVRVTCWLGHPWLPCVEPAEHVSNAYLMLLGLRDEVFRHLNLNSILTQLFKTWVKMFKVLPFK
jgi:hypothetical protein